ncbi:MAG: hypothetical protein ABIP29_12665 [Candidatus Eisenbacteria bacterium]
MSAEPRAPRRPADERAPIFGRWEIWYALLVAELIAVLLLCGWLAAHNG